MFNVKFIFISLFFINKKINAEENSINIDKSLPICPYIDPIKEMAKWDAFDFSACKIVHFRPENNSSIESKIYSHGENSYGYNSYASDMIGARRNLSNIITHERCLSAAHEIGNLKANIIIVYHNEAFSVLVRMLNSIFTRTPHNIIRQVMLYDDFSNEELRIDKYLDEYINLKKTERGHVDKNEKEGWTTKVKMYRAEKREGLIRAKVLASRLIRGSTNNDLSSKETNDVLVFLDSHCEVTENWIQPLLAPIYNNSKTVVAPVVDIINAHQLQYSKAMIARGTFNWELKFKWEYFDWSYFNDLNNYVKTFKTVVPSGGLIAIREDYFREIGEYDTGMEIWGAENIELSVKVWSCGGTIVTSPCSRVGHIFRVFRPYSSMPGIDTNLYNSLRIVNVWFDDYKEKFFATRPRAKSFVPGDLKERIELKKKLNCKPFQWYLENVHKDLLTDDIKKMKIKTEL